ncbi:hypothetical protein E0Z06_00680 [Rheinheimera sp. D18]|nr:hypothetical protein [Rheinheimera sp. D18]QBL08127.1 hypothetical protein E0Z06_00680 [Rheinheimera sp. D18]
MNKNTPVALAIKAAILTTAFGSAGFTASIYAQDNTVAPLERIEVTGSRIKRTDLEGVAPVTVITA